MAKLPTFHVTMPPDLAELVERVRRFYHMSDGMGLLAPRDDEILETALITLAERALRDWPDDGSVRLHITVVRERAKLAAQVQAIRNRRRRVRVIRLSNPGGDSAAQQRDLDRPAN